MSENQDRRIAAAKGRENHIEYVRRLIPTDNPDHTFTRKKLEDLVGKIHDEMDRIQLGQHAKDDTEQIKEMRREFYRVVLLVDEMSSLMVMAFHYMTHNVDSAGLHSLESKVREVDTEFNKHKPKLEFIDKKVDEAVEREKRAQKASHYG